MFKVAVSLGIKEAASKLTHMQNVPMGAIQDQIDVRMSTINEHMKKLEAYGHLMDPRQRQALENGVRRMAADMQEMQQWHGARQKADWIDANSAHGQPAPRPVKARKGFLGFGARAGTPPQAPAYRAEELADTLSRAGALGPAEAPGMMGKLKGMWNGMGALGKLGVGAGAVAGGGMLLKSLMGSGDEQREYGGYKMSSEEERPSALRRMAGAGLGGAAGELGALGLLNLLSRRNLSGGQLAAISGILPALGAGAGNYMAGGSGMEALLAGAGAGAGSLAGKSLGLAETLRPMAEAAAGRGGPAVSRLALPGLLGAGGVLGGAAGAGLGAGAGALMGE